MRVIWIALLMGGCAAPRVITGITLSGDQAKMVYSQVNTGNTGVIRCDVAEDGSLEDCEKQSVTFKKKKDAKRAEPLVASIDGGLP